MSFHYSTDILSKITFKRLFFALVTIDILSQIMVFLCQILSLKKWLYQKNILSVSAFPMPQDLGVDTKITSLACSEPKLQFRPFYLILNGQNGHFGHSGQSENGLNGFPMPKNLGIDTKIKSLACSEPKLQFRPS